MFLTRGNEKFELNSNAKNHTVVYEQYTGKFMNYFRLDKIVL